jgi:hypothetical protein
MRTALFYIFILGLSGVTSLAYSGDGLEGLSVWDRPFTDAIVEKLKAAGCADYVAFKTSQSKDSLKSEIPHGKKCSQIHSKLMQEEFEKESKENDPAQLRQQIQLWKSKYEALLKKNKYLKSLAAGACTSPTQTVNDVKHSVGSTIIRTGQSPDEPNSGSEPLR